MNKIQKIGAVLAAVALAAMATQVSAMTETWSAQTSRFLTLDSSGTAIAQGSRLELGVLLTSEANMLGNDCNSAFLEANFNEWVTSTVGTGTGLEGSFAITSATPGAGFFSTKLYLLVYSAPTAGDAPTQVGLYSAPSWISPASDAASAGALDLGDADVYAIIGTLSSGTVTSPTDIAGTDAAQLHLCVTVPEPSSIMLVGLGVLGMVGLMRRRS